MGERTPARSCPESILCCAACERKRLDQGVEHAFRGRGQLDENRCSAGGPKPFATDPAADLAGLMERWKGVNGSVEGIAAAALPDHCAALG